MPKPNATASIKTARIVIAIDGPAGAGKSTVAKMVAKRLNISYLDTGAMYRALTLKALKLKADLENGSELADLAQKTKIELKNSFAGLRVYLDGKDVSEDIRSLAVTNNTFYIARAPAVRKIMVGWQRDISKGQSVVAEGRDIGTVVFPKATKKFYLDADFKARAVRRINELKEKGKTVNEEELTKELYERDQKDFTRKVSPLKKADDAIVIDSTGLSVEQTAEKILEYLSKTEDKRPQP